MCLTTDMAVRNLTVRVTLTATKWVTFWLLSATSPPNACNLCREGQIRAHTVKHSRRQTITLCIAVCEWPSYLGVLLHLCGLKACEHDSRSGLWRKFLTGGLNLIHSVDTCTHKHTMSSVHMHTFIFGITSWTWICCTDLAFLLAGGLVESLIFCFCSSWRLWTQPQHQRWTINLPHPPLLLLLSNMKVHHWSFT